MIYTGYYAKVANVGRCWSGVHLVANGKPICGYKPAKTMSFQMCSPFVVQEYIECKKCKEISKNMTKVIK